MQSQLHLLLAIAMSVGTSAPKEMGEGKEKELLNLNVTSYEDARHFCVRENTDLSISCLPEEMHQSDKDEISSQIVRGFWKDEKGVMVTKTSSEGFRFTVDERLNLHITDARAFYTGVYTCVILLSDDQWKVASIHLLVYTFPSLQLEYPLFFRTKGKCHEKVSLLKQMSSAFYHMMCGSDARHECQYGLLHPICLDLKVDNASVMVESKLLKMGIVKSIHAKEKIHASSRIKFQRLTAFSLMSNRHQALEFLGSIHAEVSRLDFISALPLSKALTEQEFFETCPAGYKLIKALKHPSNDQHHWTDPLRDRLGVVPEYHVDDNNDYNVFIPVEEVSLQDVVSGVIRVEALEGAGGDNSSRKVFRSIGSMCVPCGVGSYKTNSRAGPCSPCPLDSYQDERGRAECKLCPDEMISGFHTGLKDTTLCFKAATGAEHKPIMLVRMLFSYVLLSTLAIVGVFFVVYVTLQCFVGVKYKAPAFK